MVRLIISDVQSRTTRRCLLFFSTLFFVVIKVKDAAEKSEKRAAIALQLKDGLLRLGPTFIKLGQLLSTRWVYGPSSPNSQ